MDDYYPEEAFYDDSFDISDFINDWNQCHSLEHAPVGGPVWQPAGDPIIIPGYTLDYQGVWQPPDDLSPSPPAGHSTLAEEGIAAEVMGLPSHLTACLRHHQAGVASRQAYGLDDSFFSDRDTWLEESPEHAALPEEEGASMAPQFPPEDPGRVAAEVAVVEHMLDTVILWMSTIDSSTLSPDMQESLGSHTAHTFYVATCLPHTQEVLECLTSTAPPSVVDHVGTGTTTHTATPPVEAPSTSTQRQRHRRPRRN